MQREKGRNMSFSGEVREELFKHISSSRHCQLAELAALFSFSSGRLNRIRLLELRNAGSICFETENELVARKCFTLLKKTFNIYGCVRQEEEIPKKGSNFCLEINDQDEMRMVIEALTNEVLLQKSCCMRAYLRGAFLAAGSVSDPNKSYHFEIVCNDEEQAEALKDILANFDIEAKDILRKNHNVIYIKEGSLIVEALNVMEAHVALMDFENSRILKDMRNSLNRRVNCEAANITKTVNAAVKQSEDIKKVMEMPEYKTLPQGVKQIAELRLQYPDASLKELGELSDPPIGKSGVNHRLRKLAMLAMRE